MSFITATTTVIATFTATATKTVTSDRSTATYATGIPSALPRVITPPGGMPPQGVGSTLVQLGFLYPLNYPFVLAEPLSQQQIFQYLSKGIAYDIVVSEADVTIQSLRAYDTTDDLHYITTLAYIYLPSDNVTSLNKSLHAPTAELYDNPDASVKSLMSMINPAIPLVVDESHSSSKSLSVSTRSTSDIPAPTLSPTPYTSSSNLSSNQKISIGVVIPIAVITLLLLGAFWWRRRRHNTDLQSPAEKDVDEKRYEMATEAKRFELQTREYELELPTGEESRRSGLQARQELHGGDFLQELPST